MAKTDIILNLFASATAADVTGTVYVTVPRKSTLVAIAYSSSCDSQADNAGCVWQVSRAAIQQNNTNDAGGLLLVFQVWQNGATAVGIAPAMVNGALTGIAVPFDTGDRIYLNGDWTAGIVGANVNLYFVAG